MERLPRPAEGQHSLCNNHGQQGFGQGTFNMVSKGGFEGHPFGRLLVSLCMTPNNAWDWLPVVFFFLFFSLGGEGCHRLGWPPIGVSFGQKGGSHRPMSSLVISLQVPFWPFLGPSPCSESGPYYAVVPLVGRKRSVFKGFLYL